MASSTVTPESEHEARVSEVEHFLSSPSSIALHRNAHESSASVVAGASLPCRVMISPSSNEANATAGSIRSAELVARAHSDSRRKLSDMWSGASSATEPEDRRGGEPARPLRNSDSPPLASPAVMPPVSPNCFLTEFNEIFYHLQKRDLPREKGDDDNQATGQEVARVKDSEEGLKRMVLGGWGEKIGPDVVTVFTMYDGPKAKGKKKIAQKQKKASPDKKGGDPALVELVSTASTESRAEKTLLGKTKQRQGSLGNKRKDAFPTSSRILKQKEIGLVGRSGFAGKRASAKTKSRESVDKIKERRKGGGEVPNLKLVHKVVNNLMDEFKGLPEPEQPAEKASNNSSAALYTPHSTPVAETALLPKKPKGRWSSNDTSFAATAQLKKEQKGTPGVTRHVSPRVFIVAKGKKGTPDVERCVPC
ncbi:hypothetical protein HPB48_014020 [Haemaphysalis longicornis]|uniref:Uncharacterized protein n=1 Tax=Haemaphysalis longicornis TaxID=44386 RepID=A0A9J6G7I8_HAELO|nr:hypothetical protein HPB48_014020 [Haemaphysalis longicornis]